MEIIPIVRRGYQIFVTPLKYEEIDFSLCSRAFKNHVDNLWKTKDLIIHVKCDSQGNLDLRKAKHDKFEYRILNISKMDKVDVQEYKTSEYRVEKIPCNCICHKEGMTVLHIVPCCNNGFKEKLIKLSKGEEKNWREV